MPTKLVNGERVSVPADELSALQAEWTANANAPPPKLPLSYWALRVALGPTRIALVDAIIDGMEAGETKSLIAEKWAVRAGFVRWGHPHTQAMIQALSAADETLDADALWALAETYQADA